MHVYCLERPDGLVKIGVSSNPTKRIAAVSSQGGFGLSRVWMSIQTQDAKWFERAAHQDFAELRSVGEWFSVEFDEAVDRLSIRINEGASSNSENAIAVGFSARLSQALSSAGYADKYHGRAECLAKVFGVSKSAANYWLNGTKLPSVDKIAKLADMCGVSIDWLVTGAESRSQQSEADRILSGLTEPQRAQAIRMIEAFAASCKAAN